MRLFFLFIFFGFSALSQNLIPNAGFEHNVACPQNYNQISKARGWSNPTKGSPDYYNACGNDDYSVPKNRYGTKESFNGIGYAALNGREFYREYIQIKLEKPLKANQKYYCSIQISACEGYNYVSSDIGLLFTKEKVERQDYFRIDISKPQIENHPDSIFDDYEWHEINGHFIAKGGEQYLTIGSFKEEVLKKEIRPTSVEPSWYNFIDNITTEPIIKKKPKHIIQKELNAIKNIHFKNRSFTLEEGSFSELNKILKILKRNKEITLKIIGHTDNNGSRSSNKKLSIQRCVAVKKWLIQYDIPSNRIIIEGKGDSQPLFKNTSDDNRSKNRRVEFLVI